jgi:hypothetical protein
LPGLLCELRRGAQVRRRRVVAMQVDHWCAVSSAGEVLTGDTPDALDQAIRAYWQAWCG